MPAPRRLSALLLIPLSALGLSCAAQVTDQAAFKRAISAIEAAGLPPSVRMSAEAGPRRFLELLSAVDQERAADPDSLRLVDKNHALPASFVPGDLAPLDGTGISVSRSGHRLRRASLKALIAMEKAARAEGVDLVVGSAYRSYQYQAEVFERTIRELGRKKAQSLSAPPGSSQHQLGTAFDFSPIDEAFAATKAGRWAAANAGRFGFSLSYPKGLNSITGYDWESWHFRYIGEAACALQDEFFADIQQYLFLFLNEYRGGKGSP